MPYFVSIGSGVSEHQHPISQLFELTWIFATSVTTVDGESWGPDPQRLPVALNVVIVQIQ